MAPEAPEPNASSFLERSCPVSGKDQLAKAIFEYLEIFHNRQRRHSALGMLTPLEFENTSTVG